MSSTVHSGATINTLEDMRFLIEAIDGGSFSAAARRLGVSKQLVSRRISMLEERLGVRLLNRTTRRLNATELGLGYAERARRILADVEEAETSISTHLVEPRGTLRVSAPLSFGLSHLAPVISRFLTLMPRVELDIDLTDRPVDIVAEGFDMAIRVGVLSDSSLIARRLCPVAFTLVASPDYLVRRGTPAGIEDLQHHDCLLFRHSRGTTWWFRRGGRDEAVPVKGRLRANNGEILRDSAIDGLGMAQLPDFITRSAINDGRLVPLLADHLPVGGAVHAVYPSHRQRSLPVRAFSDYLASALG